MSKLKKSIQVIANIISFNSDHDKLKVALKDPSTNWDALVKVASKHLLLPTLYNRIKEKGLDQYIPGELNDYLKELFEINYSRNESILAEVQEISNIFNNHSIKHVFLKGAAMIAGGYYNNYDRMLGDIDVLVSLDDLNKANDVLIEFGYLPIKEPLSYQFIDQKHLPRLISKQALAAIEIHSKLLNTPNQHLLSPQKFLENCIQINNISIPSNIHLFNHHIFSYLYDNHGYYYGYLDLRCIYDTIVISNYQKIEIIEFENSNFRNYFQIVSLFFNDFENIISYNKINIRTKWFLFRTNYAIVGSIWEFILFSIKRLKLYFNRLLLLCSNKTYRKTVLKHLINDN